MLGVLVNALAVLAGGSVGLLAKKGIPEKITNAIMTAIALCVIYIGVSGMLKGENTLVLIVSMVLGTAVGTLLDLDGRIERLGSRLERRFQRGGNPTGVLAYRPAVSCCCNAFHAGQSLCEGGVSG